MICIRMEYYIYLYIYFFTHSYIYCIRMTDNHPYLFVDRPQGPARGSCFFLELQCVLVYISMALIYTMEV